MNVSLQTKHCYIHSANSYKFSICFKLKLNYIFKESFFFLKNKKKSQFRFINNEKQFLSGKVSYFIDELLSLR